MVACIALAAFLVLVNVGGYALARRDKRVASRRASHRHAGDRVPERTFYLLALLAGGPGQATAFILHRHKIRKARFLMPWALAALVGVVLGATWAALLCGI